MLRRTISLGRFPSQPRILSHNEGSRRTSNLQQQELYKATNPQDHADIKDVRDWLVQKEKDLLEKLSALQTQLTGPAAQAAEVMAYSHYGRPASAKAPPLALVHEVFGEFLADADSIRPSPDTFDFVLELCAMLADFYGDEKYRQKHFNSLLGKFLGNEIYRVSLTDGVSATDGSIVDDLDNLEFACLHVEYNKDSSTGTASVPSAKIMAYHYCLLNRMAPESRLASSPCFRVVNIGSMLWICGLAFVGKVAFQPLTPIFPMLDLRPGQPAYMEQIARAFEALRHGVARLGKEYAASPLGVRPALFMLYPLTDSVRWSEVQHLVNINSLLFFARDAQTKTPKVIKYVTKYGIEVHQALSDAGLAPVLYDTVHLKGGFMQDGWTRVDMLSAEELSLVQPAVLAALDRVHALLLPNGGSVVLADCRTCNVMVKIVDGGAVDVRFIDFDWAGQAGVVQYPSFMNHQDMPWPDGVKEFEPALQIHDTRLLARHLPKVSTAAVHKLPAMQRPRHSLWRCGALRIPHAHSLLKRAAFGRGELRSS
ncbi:hypothetical protein WJX75_009796 [Coccomyxa subellipsoidea]|uniref:Aminoglycoside phosphotransferase domain-containing protein n=1 Tax=Coccomyxa subellipsoidea TaxID=248742 RepID=A0ABR2Z7F1_9CHLO